MASRANSDDEDLALALRLSQLSSKDFDEQIARRLPEGSASANYISRSYTPTREEKDVLALASRLSLLPSDDVDEQAARLHCTGSASASEETHSSTPPNDSDENDLELALSLSQLPADIFDEQVSRLNRTKEPYTAVEDSLASLLAAMSFAQVRTTPLSYLDNY
jgi:hypothetical protein